MYVLYFPRDREVDRPGAAEMRGGGHRPGENTGGP